ncbi:unnamed protein product [Amoebophrya sp. A120]|nr:unnamed protein product [Amoebophrya sp. A120]|eukprot:GSA120T00011926001.1
MTKQDTKTTRSSRSSSPSPDAKKRKVDQLVALKQMSGVVADTGDIEKIKTFKPEDATTNPTLLLQACGMPEYKSIVDAAVKKAKESVSAKASQDELLGAICDQLAVSFGCEILKLVPGYVSTEVDADLSFDTEASLAKARKIIKMYEAAGFKKERILIKLGSTWECIRACEILEKEGIHCNMTLLFSFCQARACAEAGATLISPFVGRILDWFKKAQPDADFTGEKDPGVKSVKQIYEYYRQHDYKTIVMAASFRTKEEICCLAGCDKLTIGPKFLAELEASSEGLPKKLAPELVKKADGKKPGKLTEKEFRWMLNEDQMATEKLSEGLRNFGKDLGKLKELIKTKFL